MSPARPKCFMCIHFNIESRKSWKYKCKAFPDEIPVSIIEGLFHTKKIDGQKGSFVFQSKESKNARTSEK